MSNGNERVLRQAGNRYLFSICLYYLCTALMMNYATVFLQSHGYANAVIGAFYSASALLAMAFQSIPAAVADHHPGVGTRHIILAHYALLGMSVGLVFLLPAGGMLFLAAFTMAYANVISLSAFLNVLAMQLTASGVQVRFGNARGIASVVHVLGTLTVSACIGYFGTRVIPWGLLFIAGVGCVTLWRFAQLQTSLEDGKIPWRGREGQGGYLALLRKKPRLIPVMAGVALISVYGSCVMSFMISVVENLSGTTSTLAHVIVVGALCEIPVFFLYGRLAERHSSTAILRFSAAAYFVRSLLMLLARHISIIFLAQLLQGLSYSLFFTSSIVCVDELTGPQDKAKGQALLGIMNMSVGCVVANSVSGILLDMVGVFGMLGFACMCACAGMLVLWWGLRGTALRQDKSGSPGIAAP